MQAVRAIEGADFIRYPPGSDQAIRHLVRSDAELAALESDDEVIQLAREGRRVAVLYPGDPYAFSNGSRLALALESAGIDFEAVPGLPLETAAPALSGVPLSVEGRSSSVGLGVGASGETIVMRLAAGWWDTAVAAVVADGRDPSEQAALIVNPGSPGQQRVVAPLGAVADVAAGKGLSGHALLVVGPGVELSARLDTFARRPLFGRRILVTRARHQVEPFRAQLTELGASVVEIPTLEIRPLPVDDRTRAVIGRLGETRLVMFTSANAVEVFFDILFAAGCDARALHASSVCAIGAETARCLEMHGIKPELLAGEYTAEELADILRDRDLDGARVLVPRARAARDALASLLAQRGVKVDVLEIYDTPCPTDSAPALRRLFDREGVDAVAFTSSWSVLNFVRAFPAGKLPETVTRATVACMGPVTADTARQLGLKVSIIAREYTTRGLAQALSQAIGRQG